MKKKSLLLILLMALLVPWAAGQTLFSENFEGGSMPTGWTSDGDGQWTVGTGVNGSYPSNAGQGTYNARIYKAAYDKVTMLITPVIDLSTATSAELSFMHVQVAWGTDIDELRVYYRTSTSETWTLIDGAEYTDAQSTWKTEEGIILPNINSTYQLAFEHYSNWGRGLGLDDVKITQGASCAKPTGLAATLTPGDGTIATLTWTENGTATAWVLEYGTTSDFTGATSVNVSGTPTKNLKDLTAETKYYARVKADCGGGDTSDWSTTCEFTPTNALTKTIYDNGGTKTDEHIPLYGYYADTKDTQSQFIIPASKLADINGSTINKLTFYCSGASYSFGSAVFEVRLEEVEETSFPSTSYHTWGTSAVMVYSGSLSANNNTMEIVFQTPFDYNGGNLMIGTWVTTSGSCPHTYWYGEEQTTNTAVSRSYNYQFLPKTTFNYLPNAYPKPKNLIVSNITNESATVAWAAPSTEVTGYKYQYKPEGGSWTTLTSTTVLSAPLTGLTGNTTYTFQVQAIYAGNNESAFASTSFTTECDPASIIPDGYSYGFEDESEFNCWEIANDQGRMHLYSNDDVNDAFGTTGIQYSRTGDNLFFFTFYDYPTTNPEYQTIISPELTGITNGLHVEFYYTTAGSYGPETFAVGYSTTDKQLSSFTWGNEVTSGDTDYQLFKANYPAGTKYIAFQHRSDDKNWIMIDDFSFTEAPDCVEPSNIQTPNITTTGANLSWTVGGSESAWDIYVTDDVTDVPDELTTPTYAAVSSHTNYPISGLTSGTTYYVYLRSACDATTHSDWTMPYQFNTECETIPLPYSYDFEDDALPICYNTISSDAGWNIFYISDEDPQHGSKHLIMSCQSSYEYQLLVLPEVDANYPLDEYEITFYAKLAGTYTTGRTLAVGVMTDPEDEETFVQIGNAFTPTTTYAKYKVRLNTYTGSGQYIAIKHTISNTGNTFIDHLEVNPVSLCYEPSDFACTATTGSTATFSWTAGNDGNDPQSAWHLYISTSNVAPADDIDESLVIKATENPFTVTEGLTAETVHYAWVRGNCSASSHGYSDWVGGISFMPSNYKDCTYNNSASTTNGYIPFYGSNVSTATKTQFIVPATDLSIEMLDGSVRRLTYYTSTLSASWGTAVFDIYVKEVANTEFETATFVDWDDLTQVYHGSLSISNRQMEINLDDEFVYNGGNLLIGFKLSTTGSNTYISWTSSNTTGVYHGVYQNGTSGSVTRYTYNPKITFNYRPSDTPRPLDLHTVQVLSTEATLAWTAPSENATGYEYQYKLSSSSSWSTPEMVAGTTATVPGLTAESDYDFRVRAVYAGPAYSQYAEISFTTPIACTVPTDLAQSNLTMVSADMSWTASPEVESYTLQYRTAAGYDVELTEDFSEVTAVSYSASPSYLPDGWKSYASNDDATTCYAPRVSNQSNYSFIKVMDGNYLLLTTNGDNTTTEADVYAVMPRYNNLASVSFYYAYENTGKGTLYIGYVTNNNDMSTYHNLKTITAYTAKTAYTVSDDDLAAINADNGYFTFYYTRIGSSYYSVGIEDVTVQAGTNNPIGEWIDADTYNTTGEFTITGLTAGKKYDVRVYPNCTTDPDSDNDMVTFNTLAEGKVFMTAGNWGTASNWVPAGTPVLNDNVIIRADVTIASGCEAKANNITIEGAANPTITIADGGQLIHNSAVNATLQKNITHYSDLNPGGWYFIASPVNNFSTSTIAVAPYDLFSYSESDAMWYVDHEITGQPAAHTFNTLTRGIGYLYAKGNDDVTLNFTGNMIGTETDNTPTIDLSYACSYDDLKGYNLMGNPFTRNLGAGDMTIGGTAVTSVLTVENGSEYSTCNFIDPDEPGVIKPGQGFFIQATDEGQQLVFNPSAKDFDEIGLISIKAGDESYIDKAYIQIGGGNTLRKLSFYGDKPSVYVIDNGDDYAAATIYELTGSMPVCFKAIAEDEYTITVNTKNLEPSLMMLIDGQTGDEIDLLETPSYTFKASANDSDDRFRLIFDLNNNNNYTGLDENYSGESFIYQSGDELIVNGEGELKVFDVLGRFVMSQNVSGVQRISKPETTGVYIFLLNGKAQKVVIK